MLFGISLFLSLAFDWRSTNILSGGEARKGSGHRAKRGACPEFDDRAWRCPCPVPHKKESEIPISNTMGITITIVLSNSCSKDSVPAQKKSPTIEQMTQLSHNVLSCNSMVRDSKRRNPCPSALCLCGR